MEVLAFQVRATESEEVVPVPASDKEVGELEALLVREMLPVAEPAPAGANVALKLVLCPPAKVSGNERPLVLKPVPVTASPETVTLALPVSVRITVCDPLLPVKTVPKLMLVGLKVS